MTEPNCPECGKECERKENMYALEGIFYSGLVCCGTLWSDEDTEGFDKFMEHAKSRYRNKEN